MTSIVQISDFEYELEIVHKDNINIQNKIQWFIDKYQPIVIKELLGESLLSELELGLSANAPSEQWVNLVKNIKPVIIGFVYWYFMQNEETNTSSLGQVKGKSQNSVSASPVQKMVKNWNDSVEAAYKCIEYIVNNSNLYGDYYLSLYNYSYGGWQNRFLPFILKYKNNLGI